MSKNFALPIPEQERAGILDVLRGFALLGILLDNIFGFTGYIFSPIRQQQALATYPIDRILSFGELAFINGKFYSIFSLLFGIGFSVILINNQRRGINAVSIFYRRLFFLLVFGAVHVFLLWEGDILFLYALVGCLLPLFIRSSNKTLLIWAVSLIALPVLIDIIKVFTQFEPGMYLNIMGRTIDEKTGVPLDDSFATYLFKDGNGWNEWRNWMQSGFFYRYGYILDSNRIPKVLGMFLLGFYAGRKMIFRNLEEYLPLLKKIRFWGFLIGIPGGIAFAFFEKDAYHIPKAGGLIDTALYAVSVVPLALAYVSAICIHWSVTGGKTWLRIFAPMGRMALTNYLMQTAMGILIFYGVGAGLGGDIGPVYFWPIALGIYGFQLAYSAWWLKQFQFGPLEWIWRQLTYGKRLPMKISK